MTNICTLTKTRKCAGDEAVWKRCMVTGKCQKSGDKVDRLFHTPTARRIDEMFAWVCTEPDGSEGLVGWHTSIGWVPLVGGDVDRMRSLRPQAEITRKETGWPVRLVRFTKRDDLEELP